LPIWNGVRGDELCLHVGGKRRIRCSAKIDRARTVALHVQRDPVLAGIDVGASLFQLVQYGFKQGGVSILELHAATGGGSSDDVGACLDTVGHHAVNTTAQGPDTNHGNLVV